MILIKDLLKVDSSLSLLKGDEAKSVLGISKLSAKVDEHIYLFSSFKYFKRLTAEGELHGHRGNDTAIKHKAEGTNKDSHGCSIERNPRYIENGGQNYAPVEPEIVAVRYDNSSLWFGHYSPTNLLGPNSILCISEGIRKKLFLSLHS